MTVRPPKALTFAAMWPRTNSPATSQSSKTTAQLLQITLKLSNHILIGHIADRLEHIRICFSVTLLHRCLQNDRLGASGIEPGDTFLHHRYPQRVGKDGVCGW